MGVRGEVFDGAVEVPLPVPLYGVSPPPRPDAGAIDAGKALPPDAGEDFDAMS